MTPREALVVQRGLVDSMKCAGCDGRGVVSIARLDRFGEPIREDHACSMCCGDGADARAIAARPALETLAGCVVVSRETAQLLVVAAKTTLEEPLQERWCRDLRASIAEAEEALR